MNRLGCDCNGASIDREALLFGKSFGTIEKYTDRVFTAILSLERDHVYWPDIAERKRTDLSTDVSTPSLMGLRSTFLRDQGLMECASLVSDRRIDGVCFSYDSHEREDIRLIYNLSVMTEAL